MENISIHTLDARGNPVLHITQNLFALNNEQVRREIVNAVEYTAKYLKLRGIEYRNLKTALTPQIKRREIVLLFDLSSNDITWYGRHIHEHLFALFSKNSSHSILHGDLLHLNELSRQVINLFNKQLSINSLGNQIRNNSELYCLYINNCSDQMVESFDKGFKNYPTYIGCVDTTYSSAFKHYLSFNLCNAYIKHQDKIIQPHEDDLSEIHNQNTLGFSFDQALLSCLSIQSLYFDLFLSYKIERPEVVDLEHDQIYSLNAISSSPMSLKEFAVHLDDRKLEYLKKEKAWNADREIFFALPQNELEQVIKNKITSNYLYNLRFKSDYNLAAFDIVLELKGLITSKPIRYVLGCSYEQERKAIRITTMY